jgi:hypothetical protein
MDIINGLAVLGILSISWTITKFVALPLFDIDEWLREKLYEQHAGDSV